MRVKDYCRECGADVHPGEPCDETRKRLWEAETNQAHEKLQGLKKAAWQRCKEEANEQ
jgi:hypothetical protein